MTYKHGLYYRGGGWEVGRGGSVLLQAPEHCGRHALLLQPDLCGEGERGSLPAWGLPHPCCTPALGAPLTVGLQVHLILVLVLAQLDLVRVGLLGQLCQLLPRSVAPGGRGVCCSGQGTVGARQPSLHPSSPKKLPTSPGLASPHKQDLALGPWGLVPLRLGRELLCPLLQQLHVIHAALSRRQVGH